jgi:CheY-like chemotaxis protein
MLAAPPNKILYIDDDSDDCFFLNQSLQEYGVQSELVYSCDGEDAVQYLNSVDDKDLPSLIVLDMNMPKWDGRQTLRYLKQHPRLSGIPVVILSTSENGMDQEVSKLLGAVSYYKKPFHYDGYKQIIQQMLPFLPAPSN